MQLRYVPVLDNDSVLSCQSILLAMSFYIQCVGQEAFVAASTETNAALRLGRLPLDRFSIEFYSDFEIAIRESNRFGKFWSFDPIRNAIVLGDKPEPFQFRYPASNSAEFVLSCSSGVMVTIGSNSELIARIDGPARFALRSLAAMNVISGFPQPSTIDQLCDLADESHRAIAKKSACQIRQAEGSTGPKPILMRRRMPMSSSDKIGFFTRLSNMLRLLPISESIQLNVKDPGNVAIIRLLLHTDVPSQQVESTATTENFIVPLEHMEANFIQPEQIRIKKRPGWHNLDIMAKIDEAIKLDMAVPFLKVPGAVLDIFQQRT